VFKGKSELDLLSKGITESKERQDIIEEHKLFNISKEVESLLSNLNKLEKKPNEDETQ